MSRLKTEKVGGRAGRRSRPWNYDGYQQKMYFKEQITIVDGKSCQAIQFPDYQILRKKIFLTKLKPNIASNVNP